MALPATRSGGSAALLAAAVAGDGEPLAPRCCGTRTRALMLRKTPRKAAAWQAAAAVMTAAVQRATLGVKGAPLPAKVAGRQTGTRPTLPDASLAPLPLAHQAVAAKIARIPAFQFPAGRRHSTRSGLAAPRGAGGIVSSVGQCVRAAGRRARCRPRLRRSNAASLSTEMQPARPSLKLPVSARWQIWDPVLLRTWSGQCGGSPAAWSATWQLSASSRTSSRATRSWQTS
mmetsp:Transcript_14608/g.44161  ORF Transcript_14608/g.44161 Transcript_14608/m.44161 type:complete len:230 (-) Transcript_14608:2409-3098(-)